MNELTDTRGKYIFDIKFDSGSEFRVAGNCIEDALDDVCDYLKSTGTWTGEEFGKCDYTIKAKVRTEDYDPREGE